VKSLAGCPSASAASRDQGWCGLLCSPKRTGSLPQSSRGSCGTEWVLRWSRWQRAPRVLRWQGQRAQGLLAHGARLCQLHPQASFGCHFGLTGTRVRDKVIRDFLEDVAWCVQHSHMVWLCGISTAGFSLVISLGNFALLFFLLQLIFPTTS